MSSLTGKLKSKVASGFDAAKWKVVELGVKGGVGAVQGAIDVYDFSGRLKNKLGSFGRQVRSKSFDCLVTAKNTTVNSAGIKLS